MAVPAAVRSYLARSSSLAKGDRNKMNPCPRASCASIVLNAAFERHDVDPSGEPAVEQAAKMPCPLQKSISLCHRDQEQREHGYAGSEVGPGSYSRLIRNAVDRHRRGPESVIPCPGA